MPNDTKTTLHLNEPRQETGRAPYASFAVLHRGDEPFVTLTVGDQYGHEVVIFAKDVASLRRIEEAATFARMALEGEQPIRVRM